jgi:hypothetical protein
MKGSINWLKDKAFLDYMTIETEPDPDYFYGKKINI